MRNASRWQCTCDCCGGYRNVYREKEVPIGWWAITVWKLDTGHREFLVCMNCRDKFKEQEARIQKEELLNPVDDPNGALNGQGGT